MISAIKGHEEINNAFGIFKKHFRKFIYLLVMAIHAIVLLTVNFSLDIKKEVKEDLTVFKIVDVKEKDPENEVKEEEKKEKETDIIEINKQDKFTEDVIETESEVKEIDIEYLPQHMISEMPVVPIELLNSKKVYPPLANKQRIEGVVFLELYIDQNGIIRNIKILKDPGYGFGEAAVKALEGIKCIPAKTNGIPVAVKINYPVRFKLK